MRAGSEGAVPPGGGAHISFGLVSVAANRAGHVSRIAITLMRIWLLQFPFDQVTQLTRCERRSVDAGCEPAVAADHARFGGVRDKPVLRPVVHPESPGNNFDLSVR